MSMTDPIADLLTRIRNALQGKHPSVAIPKSRMKIEIVRILKDEGYIEDYDLREDDHQGSIDIRLRYLNDGTRSITGLERVSRPGRRVYCGKSEIPRVLNGLGITILSTSVGVMTGKSCREKGVGGEVLCNIW